VKELICRNRTAEGQKKQITVAKNAASNEERPNPISNST
jgi:hypothetical protein